MNYEIDQASLDLMIELQLQDAQNVLKGKHRQEDVAPDTELAMELFKRELESLASFCLDQAMTLNMYLSEHVGDGLSEMKFVSGAVVTSTERYRAQYF